MEHEAFFQQTMTKYYNGLPLAQEELAFLQKNFGECIRVMGIGEDYLITENVIEHNGRNFLIACVRIENMCIWFPMREVPEVTKVPVSELIEPEPTLVEPQEEVIQESQNPEMLDT